MTEEEKAAFEALQTKVEAQEASLTGAEKEINKLKIKVKILQHAFIKNNMAFFEEAENKADLAALEVE